MVGDIEGMTKYKQCWLGNLKVHHHLDAVE